MTNPKVQHPPTSVGSNTESSASSQPPQIPSQKTDHEFYSDFNVP